MGKYIAFISYRHMERDQKLSMLLRKKLEGWHLPKGSNLPKKRRVFRDTDELPTSANLGDDIENALQDSGWLIALCSEEYTESLWCRREIAKYIEMGRKDRILPVLVSGEPERAVPEEIRDLEPAADLRGRTGREIRSAADECAAALLGRMAGKPSETFAASERRSRVLFRGGTAAAACAVLLGLTFYAGRTAEMTEKKNQEIAAATAEAEAAREIAEEELRQAYLANSDYIAVQAGQAMKAGDDRKAIQLALSALPEDLHGELPVSEEAVSILRMAVNRPAYLANGDYRLSDSIETDFRITGYIAGFNEGDLVLLIEDYYAKQKYLQLAGGKITDVASAARQAAVENGYSIGYVVNNQPSCDYVFCGPEKPLTWKWSNGTKPVSENQVTLNGTPFYADHIKEIGTTGGLILAWQEQPRKETEARTAIIRLGKTEAVAELEIAGWPVTADCSYEQNSVFHSEYIAIVDREGTLSVFECETGRKTVTIPGKWSGAMYPKASRELCAIDENGAAFLIDTASCRKTAAFESPSPILEMQYRSRADLYLARCTDGVRIYGGDCELKSYFPTEETSLFVVWDGYDTKYWDHSGKKFLILYDRRVDVYETDTNMDPELSDILLDCTGEFRAIYSPDSRYLYLMDGSAPSSDVSASVYEKHLTSMRKLDAETGAEIWKKEGMPNNIANGITRDGKTLWRLTRRGMTVIDAETGEMRWESSWYEAGNYDIFTEPPDGKNIAFIINRTNGKVEQEGIIFTFDLQTGELLWTRENVGVGYWNADGTKICCIRHDEDRDAGIVRIYYMQLDPEDGTVLNEHYLPTELVYNYRYRREQVSTEKDRILLSVNSAHGEPFHTKIECYSLSDGEKIQTWELDEVCDPIFSCTGEITARWTAWEDDTDYCCVLPEEGGTGPAVPTDSEAGRWMTTTLKKNNRWESIHPLNASEYVLFNGEEAARNDYNFEDTDTTTIVRISDGAVLLNMGYSPEDKTSEVTVAPDGSSLCIIGYKESRIIRLTDTDTLVRKARQRIAKEAENK